MEYIVNLDTCSRDVLRALLIQIKEECEAHKRLLDTYDSYCEGFEEKSKRLREELEAAQDEATRCVKEKNYLEQQLKESEYSNKFYKEQMELETIRNTILTLELNQLQNSSYIECVSLKVNGILEHKIECIKIARRLFGLGLKDAKMLVEGNYDNNLSLISLEEFKRTLEKRGFHNDANCFSF